MAKNFSGAQGSEAAAYERGPVQAGTPVTGFDNPMDNGDMCCGNFESGPAVGNSRRGWGK